MAGEELRGSSAPFSLSFSGSGFLALYQVGVVQSLLELAPKLLQSAGKVYGSSAGSLIAAAVVCGISLDDLKEFFFSTVKEVRNTILGPFSPKCSLLANIKAVLQQMLPEDSYQLASGRLHISLTRVVDGQNVMASEFSSKEELIQALLCSCFLPVYCGFIPPSYRGVRYVDGGFTGLQPVSSLEEAVITVSPFTGELDICPRDCPATFFCFQIFNGSIQISMENLLRISYALFPPSTVVLNDFFSQGYQDTVLFLYRNNAFGLNYCDGNFRFASMCGRNDFAQSSRTATSLCKMVPQCLSACVLAGLAVWRKQQVAGLQDPLSKVLLQPHGLPAAVRKGLKRLRGLLEGISSMVKRLQKFLQTVVPGLPKRAVARR
ncbi:patatin-like phospholipase domain-containing protein 1 [Patagioenas fasciata monilis]|uniref:Patatin-like phospholipase domain-containing protein 1 n=1 Tax=Patagioenas fasciata monilis TaxID=372326 RepID=A0A1V4KWY2_PATFA|nr:patatin-like phospholipase domain-containing protein 1 [Patagioenas fasciata monilis]